jgi:hypothetical protein
MPVASIWWLAIRPHFSCSIPFVHNSDELNSPATSFARTVQCFDAAFFARFTVIMNDKHFQSHHERLHVHSTKPMPKSAKRTFRFIT